MAWRALFDGEVDPTWLDEFDHVNFLAYQRIADKASEAAWRDANGGRGFAEREGREFVLVETHVRYLAEIRPAERVVVETALIGFDDKRFHLLHRILAGDRLAATVELLNLSFDLRLRRVAPFEPHVTRRFAAWGPAPTDAAPLLGHSIRRLAPRNGEQP